MRPHPLASAIAWLARTATKVTVRNVGHEFRGAQTIYFANHSSHVDFVIVWATIPKEFRADVRPVAAADYWAKGMRRRLAEDVFRAVLVNRHAGTDLSAARSTVDQLVESMGDHGSLILFPEGSRSEGEEIGAFHSGIVAICKRLPSVELVPTLIEGTQRVLPKGEFLPVPLLCRVTYGEPLYFDASEPRHAFLGRLRNSLADLRNEEITR